MKVLRAPRDGILFSGFESFCRLLEAAVEVGKRFDGAAGLSFAVEEKREMVLSEDAERMRFDGPWTAMSLTPHLWLYSSREGVIVRSSSSYLYTRTTLSKPAATIFLSDIHFAAFKLVMRPPLFGAADVAMASPDMFHTLRRPS